MKRVFIFLLIISVTPCFAQTKGSIKLYAYKQGVIPGVKKKVIEEGTGKEVNEPMQSMYNYFIYTASSSQITPTEVWIGGNQYSVKFERITKTPVELQTNSIPGAKPVSLVPKTSMKVLQLTPSPVVKDGMAKSKKLAAENEIVVVYKLNGKFYYQFQKTLTLLESAVLQ